MRPAVEKTCAPAQGFTLIEIMVVVTIVALMLTIGVSSMGEFVADQRLRTVASDISSDIALARGKSIELSRRVIMEKLTIGGFWTDGWRLYADMNDNAVYDNGVDLELKHFDGFKTGKIYICTMPVGAFTNQIIFRPDGRIVRAGAVAATDGIYMVDTLGDADPTNDKIRGVQFGLSGRSTVMKMNNSATVILPPPCLKN